VKRFLDEKRDKQNNLEPHFDLGEMGLALAPSKESKMSDRDIKELVIVGGGTAGWMTAAAVAKVMGPRVNITLVESDDIGIIGVGEATIPPIRLFNDLVRIDEDDFLAKTQGTFKLGVQFVDWYKKGESYSHDFGPIGKDLGYIPFHNYWLSENRNGAKYSFWDYGVNNLAMRQNKFDRLAMIPNSPLPGIVHAFHFDAGLYAKYLRTIAEKLGVKRVEGKVLGATLNGETGFIKHVDMNSGTEIAGDFFIDCSGFRGLLIGDALNTKFEDFSSWLPVNRALAVPCEKASPLTPYTRSTAHRAGWQWRIPLQHRTGNGNVYCADHMNDDEAHDHLMKNLDGKPLDDPRLIKFTTGRRENFWVKNCIAIGLSGGFLEPLESTAIHLIQSSINQLVQLFPRLGENPEASAEYNQIIKNEFDHIRDFIVLHYHANERMGEKFWDEMRNKPIPDTLKHKIELFRESGAINPTQIDLFKLSSWVQVMLGQGIVPRTFHPFVNTIAPKDLQTYMHDLRSIMNGAVERMPSHEGFIARICRARPT
jgi:tryptophan halogenase